MSQEILDLYPDKKLTLIQGSNRLLSDPWATRLSDKLEAELKSKGANIVLGQRVPKEVANAGKGRVELKDGTAIDGQLLVAHLAARGTDALTRSPFQPT